MAMIEEKKKDRRAKGNAWTGRSKKPYERRVTSKEPGSHAAKGSPPGKARGTSLEIPSYAKASEGYPPVAKSTEASSHEHVTHLATFHAFIHGQSSVVFGVGG